MAFQKEVLRNLAKGIPGQLASLNPTVYDTNNFPAGENGVTAGLAVWADYDTGVYNNAGTGKPLGIAMAVMNYASCFLTERGSMKIEPGKTVTVIKRGDVYVDTTTAAVPGQKVFVNNSDGTFSTGEAGATVAGGTETDFYVVDGGEPNSLILISAWSNR